MSLIVDLPEREFDGLWEDRKTFYVLEDPRNQHELYLWHVISFRERAEKTNVLTGREINANITYVKPIPPFYNVLGLLVYQKLDFKKNPRAKRRI